MHSELIPQINNGILKNKKVVITLGCSFVEGQGAVDLKIWENYYKKRTTHNPNAWAFTKEQQREIIKEFPYVRLNQHDPNILDFTFHEVANSFGHVLCKKYFNDEYTCINLGRRGNGNRASIKDLYFYPDILWNKIKEIIVVYCPSGPERYDFLDDQGQYVNQHGRWVTIWPGGYRSEPPYTKNSSPQDIVSYGINSALYSEKGAIMEQIVHMQELLLWCKHHKAKLIVTPGFMQTYNKDHFKTVLNKVITRNGNREITYERDNELDPKEVEKVVNMWPWENMFYPNGEPTFADLAMSQEHTVDRSKYWFYNFEYEGTPDMWITPCAHPSIKAHDLFAECLYKHITG